MKNFVEKEEEEESQRPKRDRYKVSLFFNSIDRSIERKEESRESGASGVESLKPWPRHFVCLCLTLNIKYILIGQDRKEKSKEEEEKKVIIINHIL